jgi:Metallo-beta-lactamase superfamily
MASDHLTPPSADEIEISLFGPGYGESIVIHIGNNQWILVDSCINPNTRKPAALSYLADLEIDTSRSVRLIVATHWHDDHIRGLSATVRECISAKLVISGALGKENFLTLVASYSEIPEAGVNEFVEIFRILDERKTSKTLIAAPVLATADRLLDRDRVYFDPHSAIEIEVYSLSPSDASILKALLSFTGLMPREDTNPLRILSVSPNHASVVLWLKLGSNQLLLGADLQTATDPTVGWTAILDGSMTVSGKAEIFKVAHHGSENAHESRIWSKLLIDHPFAILTPFRRGNVLLPTRGDISRISASTSNGYITAVPTKQTSKWTHRVVKDTLHDATRVIYPVHQGWGQIRLRRKANDSSSTWENSLFGTAVSLTGAAQVMRTQ